METPNICAVDGCIRRLAYKGATLCRKHYDERPDRRAYFQGTTEERFWHYADMSHPDGCWPWTGTDDGHGYGLIWDVSAGVNRYAHIYAWELATGKSADGLIIRHSCDNPPCVRAAHLDCGTRADNVADMVERERQARGGQHGQAKVSEADVVAIRELYASGGWTQKKLAERFGISQPNVSLIVSRAGWTHL